MNITTSSTAKTKSGWQSIPDNFRNYAESSSDFGLPLAAEALAKMADIRLQTNF